MIILFINKSFIINDVVISVIIIVISLILMILSILFFPKIKIRKVHLSTYWIICLVTGAILLISQLVPASKVGQALVDNTSPINPLKILALFFSMAFISIFLEYQGLFSYLARSAAKVFNHSQMGIFITFFILISILTIFTSNDIVILTFTPFICYFAKRSKINPLPYLVMEFISANTWSMMFIIGNPTNMYLASYANISFASYFIKMAIPTLVAGLIEFVIIYLLFRKPLSKPIELDDDHSVLIRHKVDVIVGLIILFTCLIFLVISSYINVEMYLISSISALVLLVYYLVLSLFRKESISHTVSIFRKLPFELIPFVVSMFVIVITLVHQGVASKIGEFLNSGPNIITYGYSSLLMSNLINNIPMSILYSAIISSSSSSLQAVYASIIGSNIGAFITPIGALAGLMFTSLLNQYEVKYSFLDFTKYGLIIGIPTITASLGALYLMFL